MINDSLNDFMYAVNNAASEWRTRAYEEYMTGFLTKTIKQSSVLNIPEATPLDTKEAILKESTASIVNTAKKIINNALLDEHNCMHNVDMAHDITSPKNFNESVQQLLAEHIYNESKDRIDVLESEFNAGRFNNFKSEEVLDYINASFESLKFDGRFENGNALKYNMKLTMSLEAEDIVDSIKADVTKLVAETEAKNSVIRDAVTQINEKREEIEGRVNGDTDDVEESEDDEEEADELNEELGEGESAESYSYSMEGKVGKTFRNLKKDSDARNFIDTISEAIDDFRNDIKKFMGEGSSDWTKSDNDYIVDNRNAIYNGDSWKNPFKKLAKALSKGKPVLRMNAFTTNTKSNPLLRVNNKEKSAISKAVAKWKNNKLIANIEIPAEKVLTGVYFDFKIPEVLIKKYGNNISAEGFYNIGMRNAPRVIHKSDLYRTFDLSKHVRGITDASVESFYDEHSFSREAAEEILKEFKELDGIDTDSIADNENVLSVADNSEEVVDTGDGEEESAELMYEDDDGETIEVDNDKFEYDDSELQPDELSEERMARDIMPLSFEKLQSRSVKFTPKMKVFLALTPDGGKHFFDSVLRRSTEMLGMLSKEDNPAEEIDKDKMNAEIEKKVDDINNLKEDTEKFMNNMGILGILSGDYQRTDDPVDNAVKSMFKPEILEPKGSPDISKEDLHSHELAEILKIGLALNDVKNKIADGADVIGKRAEMGYLSELLNEKMFEVDPTEKINLETKLSALQSIESQLPLAQVAEMQAFVAKCNEVERPRVHINSLKDIDGYGFSFNDEVEKIKKNCHDNYKAKFGGKHTIVNFDIDTLVDFILEERDTTKFDTNMFEKILAKCTEKVDITNSSEGLILLNKARVLTTAFVTADKLGMLSKEDMDRIKHSIYA